MKTTGKEEITDSVTMNERDFPLRRKIPADAIPVEGTRYEVGDIVLCHSPSRLGWAVELKNGDLLETVFLMLKTYFDQVLQEMEKEMVTLAENGDGCFTNTSGVYSCLAENLEDRNLFQSTSSQRRQFEIVYGSKPEDILRQRLDFDRLVGLSTAKYRVLYHNEPVLLVREGDAHCAKDKLDYYRLDEFLAWYEAMSGGIWQDAVAITPNFMFHKYNGEWMNPMWSMRDSLKTRAYSEHKKLRAQKSQYEEIVAAITKEYGQADAMPAANGRIARRILGISEDGYREELLRMSRLLPKRSLYMDKYGSLFPNMTAEAIFL